MPTIRFPRGATPREGQKYILNKMNELIGSGYKRIIISAPTGIGKSYVAKAIANSLGRSFIVTSTKQLQNQYRQDFPDLRSIKGKSNFECYQLMDKKHITSSARAKTRNYTCDRGQCTHKLGRRTTFTCEYKNPEGGGKKCVYYKQKDEGLLFSQTILNYAMYFQLKKFQSEIPGVHREVAIFDEAHTIENEIVRFIGFDILASNMDEARLNQSDFDLESVGGIITLLDRLRSAYGALIQRAEERKTAEEDKTAEEVMRVQRLINRFENITTIRSDISKDMKNFIVQDPEFRDRDLHKVSVSPLDISSYTPELFDADIQVFMSGTIDRKNFPKTLGLGECGYIDVPRSPFPQDSRKIEFRNVAWLNSKSPPSDEEAVAREINALLSKHMNEKGIILTSSRARCQRLLQRLDSSQARRIQMAHSVNEYQATIDEVLQAHADTHNGVLLSSSLWQGVDLKGDLSRFQIIEKCPYPYLGDRRIAAKNRADRQWYMYQTVVKVLQGFGRSIRDYDDHAITYVMDSSVQNLLKRNRDMVPAAYHDVVYGNTLPTF